MLWLTRTQQLAVAGLVAGLAGGLLLFTFRHFVIGPHIELRSPPPGLQSSSTVLVFGATRGVRSLTINGAPTLLDADGFFRTILSFPPGTHYLVVEGEDRFGREVRVVRPLVVPPPPSYTAPYGSQEAGDGTEQSPTE